MADETHVNLLKKSREYWKPHSFYGGSMSIADILRWSDFKGADLREMDLSGLNFSTKYIYKDQLDDGGLRTSPANFRTASLDRANLCNSDLSGTDLQWASLKGAILKRASFRGANLEKANLEGANLEGANFTNANLKGANLRGATIIGTNFTGAKVAGMRVLKATVKNVDWSKAEGQPEFGWLDTLLGIIAIMVAIGLVFGLVAVAIWFLNRFFG